MLEINTQKSGWLSGLHQFEDSLQKCELAARYSIKKKKLQGSLVSSMKYHEFYERAQENTRIIKRIKNPKRDKMIIKSLEVVRNSQGKAASEIRAKSHHVARRNLHRPTMQNDKNSLASRSQDYSLKLQNQRMGIRIVNSRSMVESHGQYLIKKRKFKAGPKINKGVKAFFSNQPSYVGGMEEFSTTNLPISTKPYYGFGPTILSLRAINILLNPPLGDYDLVYLQLLVQNAKPRMYQTSLIPYLFLKSTTIKFALRIRQIGEFVPLKVWKVSGLQNISLGIVDVHFLRYFQKQQEAQVTINPSLLEDKLIGKQSSGQSRVIIQDKISCKFRKQKLDHVEGSICFEYAIYRKKYQ